MPVSTPSAGGLAALAVGDAVVPGRSRARRVREPSWKKPIVVIELAESVTFFFLRITLSKCESVFLS